MKCAYCKKEVDRDTNTYHVEINGVECEIALHYDCLKKVIGEFFSRPPLIYNVTQDMADELMRLKKTWGDDIWSPHWNAGSTGDSPPPDTTRVWCKTDNESSHIPWRDRSD